MCRIYPSILPGEKPTGQEAYLYGRFYIEAKASRLALDGHQTMGFAPEKLMRDARFDAGRAYYLGDFYAETTTTTIGRTISRNWNIKTVRNDYKNTSQALMAAYPNLSALPTEDRMIGK